MGKVLRGKPDEFVVGDYLKVHFIGGEVKYYQITAIDNIFYRDAHSSLSAGSTETYANITNLDPPSDQLYWINRISINANVSVFIKQPSATNRFGTNTSPEGGFLTDVSSPVSDEEPVDIWIAEDYPPSVQIVNDTNVSITPVLWWIGKRFAVKELREEPPEYYVIKIGGIGE